MFLRGLDKAGLGSRVALRTFGVFALAAALPVALFAIVGFTIVRGEFEATASERLAEASKRYGIALNERLIQAEALMVEAARIELESGRDAAGSALLERLRIRDDAGPDAGTRWIDAGEYALAEGWRARRALEAGSASGLPRVRLHVAVSDGRREVRLTGDPVDAGFWDPIVLLPSTRLCVYVASERLHCTTDEDGVAPDDEPMSAEWPLFLKPRFGSEDWVIRTEQPSAIAMAGFRAFRLAMPLIALLAIVGATLLSAVHIRRSHRPLALLMAAARKLGRGRYSERVPIVSDDEFASVARAFNGLAVRLRRQFGLLSTLARVDRQIIENPTLEPVARLLLPLMPRLLDCDAAALVLSSDATGPGAVAWVYRRGAPLQVFPAGTQEPEVLLGLEDLPERQREALQVGGRVRGVVLLASATAPRKPRSRRTLEGLVRRLAVALANEDRERALVELAYYDPLTGLPNRAYFRDRVRDALQSPSAEPVGLLHAGIDRFRVVNDSLGRDAGDDLLRSLARSLGGLLQEGWTLARVGGDEFALLCPATDGARLEESARRLQAALQTPQHCRGQDVVVGASVGLASRSGVATDADALLGAANTALHRAKSQSPGSFAWFDETLTDRSHRRLRVEQRLRQALAGHQLVVVYQPKLDLVDGQVRALEALCRWTDDELGVVSPVEFIAVAEETGLIAPLGAAVIESAFAQMQRWRAQGVPFRHVAVNVSVQQLRDAGFPAFVAGRLARHGLRGADLQIEVTESVLANDGALLVARLRELQAMGISIAMDDFGTGYSSLASLRDLPIDVLKIDRSFVVRSCEAEADRALLGGVVQLAHILGKTVIAEGVETDAQMALLRELGCDTVQGYLIGRPASAGEAEAALQLRPAPKLLQTA